jgi:hypothetical protein
VPVFVIIGDPGVFAAKDDCASGQAGRPTHSLPVSVGLVEGIFELPASAYRNMG